ncbi:hypothetical protein DPEC_G00225880 [Dallia pectoralis]|uniref:Uncharacterized protein n=1 Tax=Dallia pectoralis TaxID=75939 RepID=A0ACC2G0U7_DALPE|nr:hypothetical protein DPEC_G00225880 [Dallia pectoralis]
MTTPPLLASIPLFLRRPVCLLPGGKAPQKTRSERRVTCQAEDSPGFSGAEYQLVRSWIFPSLTTLSYGLTSVLFLLPPTPTPHRRRIITSSTVDDFVAASLFLILPLLLVWHRLYVLTFSSPPSTPSAPRLWTLLQPYKLAIYTREVSVLAAEVQQLEEENLGHTSQLLKDRLDDLHISSPVPRNIFLTHAACLRPSDCTLQETITHRDMHLGLLQQKLLCVVGESLLLHPAPSDTPGSEGYTWTPGTVQTPEDWPVTAKLIHKTFK